jgi:hypothetical protein
MEYSPTKKEEEKEAIPMCPKQKTYLLAMRGLYRQTAPHIHSRAEPSRLFLFIYG